MNTLHIPYKKSHIQLPDNDIPGYCDLFQIHKKPYPAVPLTLCRKTREDLNLKQIPIIMFSSLINEQMIMKYKNVGANGSVSKPETNKLVAMLDEMCQHR